MTTTPITSTLTEEQQSVAGKALQDTLVDLIDLSLIAKQAHWNVVGKQFRSVHLDLDELVTVAREFTDSAAERATAIGVSPDGRAETVAKTANTKDSAKAGPRTRMSSTPSSPTSRRSSRDSASASTPPRRPTR